MHSIAYMIEVSIGDGANISQYIVAVISFCCVLWREEIGGSICEMRQSG